jgi:hypothetical protein
MESLLLFLGVNFIVGVFLIQIHKNPTEINSLNAFFSVGFLDYSIFISQCKNNPFGAVVVSTAM